MRKLILLLGCLPFLTLSQNIDHWETVIFDNDIWKYLEGTYEPDTNWIDDKIQEMYSLLNSPNTPERNMHCENCAYIEQGSLILNN